MKLVNILISPEETGRGVKLAGAGRYFDEMSSTGARISQGAEVWPGADISTETIAIRDAAGASIQGAVVDAAFLAAGKKALDAGARVLAHVLIGSKTGLAAPSFAVVEQLRGLAPDRVDVVVDACQMRIEPAALGACLRRGWLVQVSGSKFMTGPPFSGALLFPSDLRARSARVKSLMTPGIGYNEDWSAYWAERLGPSGGEPDFGAPLRWLPALLETKLLRHVPAALRLHLSERFRREVTARMNQSACFRLIHLDEPAGDRLATNSIVSFEVLGTDWKSTPHALGEVACRRIFELLNQNCEHLLPHLSEAARSVLSQEFHIGQPVTLGQGPDSVTVLRLVLGLRFYTIVWHAGPGAIAAALESEISDLIRAIDKLEILASNWWKIPHG